MKYVSSINSVIRQTNFYHTEGITQIHYTKCNTQPKKLIIQFKIMCIKIVSFMLCANQKNKTIYSAQYTVNFTVKIAFNIPFIDILKLYVTNHKGGRFWEEGVDLVVLIIYPGVDSRPSQNLPRYKMKGV